MSEFSPHSSPLHHCVYEFTSTILRSCDPGSLCILFCTRYRYGPLCQINSSLSILQLRYLWFAYQIYRCIAVYTCVGQNSDSALPRCVLGEFSPLLALPLEVLSSAMATYGKKKRSILHSFSQLRDSSASRNSKREMATSKG